MATSHETDQADIRRRIDQLVASIRAKDLGAVMPIYAADMVSSDIEPPLMHVGAAAKQSNWVKAFAAYEGPSATKFATSRSPRGMAWHSRTAWPASVAC
jgi:ketosteroid isomerase-like protein